MSLVVRAIRCEWHILLLHNNLRSICLQQFICKLEGKYSDRIYCKTAVNENPKLKSKLIIATESFQPKATMQWII